MYYVGQLSGKWSVYNSHTVKPKLLDESEVELIRTLFAAAINDTANLDTIMVSPISPSKLQQVKTVAPGVPTTFYICKFSRTWSLLNTGTQMDRQLTDEEVKFLQSSFPGAVDANAVWLALVVAPISPNKYQQLTTRQPAIVSSKNNPIPK